MTSLAQLAALAGHYGAVERRLFEVLGGWVPTVPEPEAKLLLRAHSFQHAWHADLWDELAPRTGLAAVPPAAGAGLLAALDAVDGSSSTAERLVAAYRVVLPAVVEAYAAVLAAARPASDGPLVRALGLMLADDRQGISAGASLLGGIAGTPTGRGHGGW